MTKITQDNKQTVLLIGPLPPPEGGMTTSLRNLANSDLKDKYNLVVLDITGKRSRQKSNIIVGFFHQVYLIFKLIGILIKKRPKIVHIQMASYLYFYRRSLDILLCKLLGKKVIFHLRGAEFIDFYSKSSVFGKSYIRFILNISDKIIALSRVWRDFLARITRAEKIVVIPNGVRCTDFKLVNNKKRELGFSDNHIIVFFMGPIGKRKGAFDILEVIPKVASQIKDVSFIFAGPEEFKGEMAQFENMLNEKKLQKYVRYTGTITGQEKYDYYLSSDIFILPSYAENLPNAVLEAMAAGLTVIVSDVGAIPEVIQDGVNGFIVKPGDVEAIADKIVKLAENQQLRSAMGKRNFDLAREKYDMQVIAEQVDKVYEGFS